MLRAANRLLSSSRWPRRGRRCPGPRWPGPRSPVHSSRGRSTVLTARGVVRPCSRATRFSPGCSWMARVLPKTARAGVGGVAQHAPDHRPVPAVLAGAGRHALAAQPAGQVGDGGAVVGVAAEHPGDQRRLVLDDLVARRRPRVGLADVPVAERGAGEHVHRPGPGAVGLAAPVPLHQLGFLVLGEHALELDQQLVFGGVAARPLDELHPHPGAGELLDQQRLVGELAGQPVRGVAQHHVHAALGGQVPQRLQGRADQRRAGMALVLEHPAPRGPQAGWSRRARAAPRSATRSSRPSSAGRWRPGHRSPRSSRAVRPSWPGRAARARRCGTNMA